MGAPMGAPMGMPMGAMGAPMGAPMMGMPMGMSSMGGMQGPQPTNPPPELPGDKLTAMECMQYGVLFYQKSPGWMRRTMCAAHRSEYQGGGRGGRGDSFRGG